MVASRSGSRRPSADAQAPMRAGRRSTMSSTTGHAAGRRARRRGGVGRAARCSTPASAPACRCRCSSRGTRSSASICRRPMLRSAPQSKVPARPHPRRGPAGDGRDAPRLRRCPFDAVVAQYLLTLVPDPERALDELVRVVRPGGEIVLVNHVGQADGPVARVEESRPRSAPRSAGARTSRLAASKRGRAAAASRSPTCGRCSRAGSSRSSGCARSGRPRPRTIPPRDAGPGRRLRPEPLPSRRVLPRTSKVDPAQVDRSRPETPRWPRCFATTRS